MSPEMERFCRMLTERLGLVFDDSRRDELGVVLSRRMAATQASSLDSYLARCIETPDEMRTLATQLTVNETYFYRNANHFRVFADLLTGAWMESGRPRRILSAGSASGEEAYTLAILLREHGFLPRCSIDAVDISLEALKKGRAGRFSAWSLRTTSEAVQERWFKRDGAEYVLADEIRSMVTFSERNLVADDPSFFRTGAYDVIFCRNVLIYFSPEAIRTALAHFATALAPGGLLFLGDAETLRGIGQDFHLRHTHDTFYYERKAEEVLPVIVPKVRAPAPRRAPVVRPEPFALAEAVQLVAAERFADALAVLERAPTDNHDAHLLRAVVLTNLGRIDDAWAACDAVLRADEFNVGAHYLRALCAVERGDDLAAEKHDQIAIYLDPSFAMPHLHMGLLLKRRGDADAARQALLRASSFLAGEDAARIALYGGGFSRDALLEVCRAECATLGGPRS